MIMPQYRTPVEEWAAQLGIGRKRILFLISGPSGVGKTSVVQQVLLSVRDLDKVVTTTTRPPRPDEEDGRNYFFVSRSQFDELIHHGAFVEWKNHFGEYYGLTWDAIDQTKGSDAIFDVDTEGKREVVGRVKEQLVTVFLGVRRSEELQARLARRGDLGARDIADRLSKAAAELEAAPEYDYFVANEELATAVAAIEAIITAERCRRDTTLMKRILEKVRRRHAAL